METSLPTPICPGSMLIYWRVKLMTFSCCLSMAQLADHWDLRLHLQQTSGLWWKLLWERGFGCWGAQLGWWGWWVERGGILGQNLWILVFCLCFGASIPGFGDSSRSSRHHWQVDLKCILISTPQDWRVWVSFQPNHLPYYYWPSCRTMAQHDQHDPRARGASRGPCGAKNPIVLDICRLSRNGIYPICINLWENHDNKKIHTDPTPRFAQAQNSVNYKDIFFTLYISYQFSHLR